MTTLPDKLRAWRTAHKLSLEKAARRIGVTTSTLYRWEHGAQPGQMAQDALVRAGVITVQDQSL